jgi:hypothetical protein
LFVALMNSNVPAKLSSDVVFVAFVAVKTPCMTSGTRVLLTTPSEV